MMKKDVQRIKTHIKFNVGLENAKDRLYGFVTKEKSGSWKGCRVNQEHKKIVLVDPMISQDIIPNLLYSCSLWPMKSGNGFVAKSATLVRFEPTILTSCNEKKGLYSVTVRFGNKNITYDPSSKDKKKLDIAVIADKLRKMHDLKNAQQTAEDFINNACLVKKLYEQNKMKEAARVFQSKYSKAN